MLLGIDVNDPVIRPGSLSLFVQRQAVAGFVRTLSVVHVNQREFVFVTGFRLNIREPDGAVFFLIDVGFIGQERNR